MDGVFVLDSKRNVVFEGKPKVEQTVENPIGNSGRTMLADISNMQRKPSIVTKDNNTMKGCIEQLQKENAALKKLLADKDRVIGLNGAQLHELGITLQKMQQQNFHLAQSNSQMLAELNSGKDRLKDLQHQLGCKNGLLTALKLELERTREAKTCETNDNKEMEVCTVAERDKDQHCNSNINKRQKSKSLCPGTKAVENGFGENQRVRGGRQSARFKHDEIKLAADELFKTNDNKDKMQEDDDVACCVKKEDNGLVGNKASEESRRWSISRPSREAAKKVQSYREVSLKLKMRKPE